MLARHHTITGGADMDSLSHGFWLELAKPAAQVLLAVGFGAQTLVKDLISGLFLLLENQVRVGDVVSVGDKGGLVESMGLRVLTLRDASGNVHIIPNGDRVTNMTRDYSRYVFDIGIAYREDPDEAMRVIQDVGDALEKDVEFAADILEPLEMLGVERFTDSAHHSLSHQDAAHQAVADRARVQPPAEEGLRRPGDRDPLPAPHDLLRSPEGGNRPAAPHRRRRRRAVSASRCAA
jgi:hypothetical protein